MRPTASFAPAGPAAGLFAAARRQSLRALGILALLAAALPSWAVEFSANVAVVSDYVFRGISQTNEDPAVQAGLDLGWENGFYVGVWASNVDFGNEVEVEIDIYGGYSGEAAGIAYDVGLLAYQYPDDGQGEDPDSSFYEAYFSLGYKGATLGVNYTTDNFGETGKATYIYLGYEMSLPQDLTLSLQYGMQAIEDEAGFGTPDYVDYVVSLSRSWAGIDFTLNWHDTDIPSGVCDDICGSRVVLGLSKEL